MNRRRPIPTIAGLVPFLVLGFLTCLPGRVEATTQWRFSNTHSSKSWLPANTAAHCTIVTTVEKKVVGGDWAKASGETVTFSVSGDGTLPGGGSASAVTDSDGVCSVTLTYSDNTPMGTIEDAHVTATTHGKTSPSVTVDFKTEPMTYPLHIHSRIWKFNAMIDRANVTFQAVVCAGGNTTGFRLVSAKGKGAVKHVLKDIKMAEKSPSPGDLEPYYGSWTYADFVDEGGTLLFYDPGTYAKSWAWCSVTDADGRNSNEDGQGAVTDDR